jgi:two-component system cell cycle sensor histidine kinase/response regulator CckA
LIVEDEVTGVLAVQSDDLTQDDVPAITAFAHQMAAAWRKAQLMQDLQNSLEELKRTQAQLRQAQKMEALGQLAAGIAHDFNNLLTPISGFATLLLWTAPQDSQQQEYLRQIKVAAERATALTRQLRLFTRQEAGERHLVQLNSVVEETRDLLEHSIPKEITIELRLASKLWAVEADPSQITQVLMNLCLNARDAMPDGGTLTLKTGNVILDEEYARTVPEAQPGRYVRLSVSDTGCGMSPEVQARLFEPFFTTKEPSKGTGLGLAVVYGIVKGHGGFINVYSEVEQGSTFRVYLPAIEMAVQEKEVEGLELPTGTETILLVDDEEMVLEFGQGVLERCGYTVLTAEDGVQALEVDQAHQGKITLVVLDAIMPQMSGRECLRRLRELDPQVKVLISTGYTAEGLAQELVAEGALGVVEKSSVLQDFAVAVRAALDQS